MIYEKQYFEYLQSRSQLSLIYKKFFVYPRLNKRFKGKVLDYGCGVGDLISYKKEIIGVDINEYCTKYCSDRGFDATTIKNNILPFQDNKFSTIILDNVFEHLDNPQDQFDEIKRVLKDDGSLIIGVPGINGHNQDDTHIQLYEEGNLKAALTSLGFSTKEIFYTPVIKSKFLSQKLSFYVLWGVFTLIHKNT